MRIKLLCQEIELIKVDENATRLRPEYDGLAKISENKIYFNGNHRFSVLIHEIVHFFLFLTGNEQRMNYTEEQIGCIIGKMIHQLLLENGDDIIKQLKEFANKIED